MPKRRSSLFVSVLWWAVLGGTILSAAILWQHRVWVAVLVGAAVALASAFVVSRAVADATEYPERFAQALPSSLPVPPEGEQMRELAGISEALREAAPRLQAQLEAAHESGRKLEALLDSMQDAVTAIDGAGRISWANRPMQRLMKAAHGSVRTGHSLVQTIRAPEILECVQIALESRELVERRPVAVLPGHIVAVSAAPMPDGGAVIVMHDITRIEQVERTQREFIANVSHELRTPLTSIQGYVEMLLEVTEDAAVDPQMFSPERQQEFLEAILKSARRMGRLTDDLLALARVESGEQKLRPEPTPVALLVQECVQAASGLMKEKNGKLQVVGAVPEAEVMADNDALLQILNNLIENALNYGRSEDGWAQVELSVVRAVEGDADEVWFRVRDHGAGIPLEHQGRLFERFYRVDKARSRESGGTGLGLAIARHIVEAHRGRIWVESELGQGSSFVFALPCLPNAVPPALLPEPAVALAARQLRSAAEQVVPE